MLKVSEIEGQPLPDEWYGELQDFYAEHMRYRDEGALEQWLGAFEENAGTLTNVFPEQAKQGRVALAAAVRELDAQFASAGMRRRHRLGTLIAVRRPDACVLTRYYALVVTTRAGEHTEVHSVSVASDVLTSSDDGVWTVRSREVIRDDLRVRVATSARRC